MTTKTMMITKTMKTVVIRIIMIIINSNCTPRHVHPFAKSENSVIGMRVYVVQLAFGWDRDNTDDNDDEEEEKEENKNTDLLHHYLPPRWPSG